MANATAQQQVKYLVFGRDEREFPSQNFVPLLQLENISIEQLVKKIVKLDDAGAYKNLKIKVEDLFRFGTHHQIQVIYLAHYAKDVLPVVRENCFKIYITINNTITFSSRLYKLIQSRMLVFFTGGNSTVISYNLVFLNLTLESEVQGIKQQIQYNL